MPYNRDMQIVFLETPEARARGLQHRPFVEDGILFVFPNVRPGSFFHSQNVPEPFDIAFLSAELEVLAMWYVRPPMGLVQAPGRTAWAVEAKGGRLPAWGFWPGRFI